MKPLRATGRNGCLLTRIETRKKLSQTTCLKNVFKVYVRDPRKISNLLNYRFSILGKFSGSDKPLPKQKRYIWKTFLFTIVTEKEYFDAKSLGKNQPLGSSLIPAWALTDVSPIATNHLSYIVNNCIKNLIFQNA